MTDDLRIRIAAKVDELADLIWEEENFHRRETLHSLAVDDLFDRMAHGTANASALARAFTDVTRRFWRREPENFSVRVDEPRLTLVKGEPS